MTGISSRSDGSAVFGHIDRTDVVVSELNQHEIARAQTVIHPLPSALVQECATAATSHGSIHYTYLALIKHRTGHSTPAPHAVSIFILVFYSTVTCDEYHRLAVCTIYRPCIQFHILHHSLQWVQCWIMTSHQPFSSRTGIHHRTKTTGVYLIQEEMIICLPLAILIKLACRYFVQVDKWHTLFGGHLHQPLCVGLTHYLSIVIVGITRRKRHQYGISALRPYIIYILTHISAIGVNGLVFTSFLNRHLKRIITYTRNTGSGTTRIVRAIIIMSDGNNHPVARTYCLLDGLPQLIIECATAHASKRLILNGNL